MRPVVREQFLAFTEPLEGGIPYLYADIRNLITISYGNLVDPLSAALGLPLMHSGGVVATKAEITSAWLAVKGDPNAASRGHTYARGLTTLRLTREGMGELALGVLGRNDGAALARFPDWEDYPACAQLAIHSLFWACGSAARFPKLYSAVQARDWDACSVHIQMREITPEGLVNAGLRARNTANRRLMINASRVQAYRLDPDTLNWTSLIGVQDAPTLPDLSQADDYPHTPTTYVDTIVGRRVRPGDPPDDAT